jgi:prolipoprotein diacylglyceryltransferase
MQQVLWRIPIQNNWFPDGIPVYGFGMMLFLAFIVCTWLGGRRAQREGIAKEHMQDLAIWLFLGGLLGARITYILQEKPTPSFTEFLARLPRIWDGGIILYGSVLGALAAYVGAYLVIFRKLRVSTLKIADIVAPSVAVGLALGRIGCFLNGCCYGQVACAECAVYPVHFPISAPAWEGLVDSGYQTMAGFTLAENPSDKGVRVGKVDPDSAAYAAGLRPGDVIVEAGDHPIDTPGELTRYFLERRRSPGDRGKIDLALVVRPEGAQQTKQLDYAPRSIGLHPTQLYETVSMVLLFLLLTAFYPFRRHDGEVMALLMCCYGVHRFLNEMLRDDPRPLGFERYSSVFLFAAGVVLWLVLLSKPVQYRPRMEPAKSERTTLRAVDRT